jgi:hypothetical protein
MLSLPASGLGNRLTMNIRESGQVGEFANNVAEFVMTLDQHTAPGAGHTVPGGERGSAGTGVAKVHGIEAIPQREGIAKLQTGEPEALGWDGSGLQPRGG